MENKLQNYVVNNLRVIVNENRITQEALGDKMNLSRHMIANYLKGRTELTLKMIEKFANALDISAIEPFIGFDGWGGSFNPKVIGKRNKTFVSGRNLNVNSGAELEIENRYLKQIIEEKNEQIKLLKTLIK